MSQIPCNFQKDIIIRVSLDYLLYLPEGYGKMLKKWPLILFLHGAGERGDNIEAVKTNGIPKVVEKMGLQFITVSPQCPGDSWWGEQFDTLNALLDEIVEKYEVDTDRIYLTGLSMGGYGTWLLAANYPEKFAAIAPVCGGGDPEIAPLLKDMPISAFHGAKDDIVPLEESEIMIEALKEYGNNVKFTVYENAGHDSWTPTYDNPELYEWLLQNSLDNKK